MSDRIAIALAADSNYFCGLLVTATSIARFANKDAKLIFNVLDDGISDSDFAVLSDRVAFLHERSEIRRFRIDGNRFAGLPDWHGGRTAYARLLLSEFLPDDDFVIYCDVDFLWLDDIVKLWNHRDPDVPFWGVRDANAVTKRWEAEWYRRQGLSVNMERFFCSGLAFFNLRLFREEGLDKKLLEFVVRTKAFDQTALNAVLEDRHHLLPEKWQLFSRDSPVDSFRLPFVIHYAGDIPWKISKRSHMLTDIQLLWFHFDASVRGISVWRSLRRHYSACEIVLNRLAFKVVMGFPPLKFAFDALMRKLGRWGFYEKLPPRVFTDLKRACR